MKTNLQKGILILIGALLAISRPGSLAATKEGRQPPARVAQQQLTDPRVGVIAPGPVSGPKGRYLVVLADDQLRDATREFVDYKGREGFTMEVVTLREILDWTRNPQNGYRLEMVPVLRNIYKLYRKMTHLRYVEENTRSDIPSRIRHYFKYKYQRDNLKYVLLVGEFKDFPMVSFWDQFQTDFYYSDMDGEWDRNRNGVYGEVVNVATPTMVRTKEGKVIPFYEAYRPGRNLSEYDEITFIPYMPELGLGRIPYNDTTIVRDVLRDNIVFQSSREAKWKRNGLFMAVSVFIQYDAWYYVEAAKDLWDHGGNSNTTAGYTSVSLYGWNALVPGDMIRHHPIPDCTLKVYPKQGEPGGYIVPGRKECWFDKAENPGFGFVLVNTHGLPSEMAGVMRYQEADWHINRSMKPTIMTTVSCVTMHPYKGFWRQLDIRNIQEDPVHPDTEMIVATDITNPNVKCVLRYFDNIAMKMVRNGIGPYLGSYETTVPGLIGAGAWIAEEGMVKNLQAGMNLAQIMKAVLVDYNEKVCRAPVRHGFLRRTFDIEQEELEDSHDGLEVHYYKNCFIFGLFGDPTVQLVAN